MGRGGDRQEDPVLLQAPPEGDRVEEGDKGVGSLKLLPSFHSLGSSVLHWLNPALTPLASVPTAKHGLWGRG